MPTFAKGILLLLVMLALSSCSKSRYERMSLDALLSSRGTPLLVASDLEVVTKLTLETATLYGIKARPTPESARRLRPGQILIYCDDPRFVRAVQYHFDDMNDPTQYTGQTMYSALFRNETKLVAYRVIGSTEVEPAYSDFIVVAFLEVGDKGHPVLVRPAPIRGSGPD